MGDSFQAVLHFEDADDLITLKGIQVNISSQNTVSKRSLNPLSNRTRWITHASALHTGLHDNRVTCALLCTIAIVSKFRSGNSAVSNSGQ